VVNLAPQLPYPCGWPTEPVCVFWRRDTALAFAEIRTLDRLNQPVHYTNFAILTPYEQYNIKIINKYFNCTKFLTSLLLDKMIYKNLLVYRVPSNVFKHYLLKYKV
jgi:hypothetical protein